MILNFFKNRKNLKIYIYMATIFEYITVYLVFENHLYFINSSKKILILDYFLKITTSNTSLKITLCSFLNTSMYIRIKMLKYFLSTFSGCLIPCPHCILLGICDKTGIKKIRTGFSGINRFKYTLILSPLHHLKVTLQIDFNLYVSSKANTVHHIV